MTPERIQARVARINTDDLMLWADAAAAGMMRHLDDFRRSRDEAHLGEVSLAALSMGYVVDELASRVRKEREQLDSPGHAR